MEDELQLPSVFQKRKEKRMKDLLLGFFVFVSGVITGAIGFIFSILLLADRNKEFQSLLVTTIKDFIVKLLYGESHRSNYYNGYGFRDGVNYTNYYGQYMRRKGGEE